MPLTGKQKRKLRALGHHLTVLVQVGADGVTDGVISATSAALEDHELVKVRIADDRDGREQAVEKLARGTRAEVAQVLGRTALLYRARAEKPEIKLS